MLWTNPELPILLLIPRAVYSESVRPFQMCAILELQSYSCMICRLSAQSFTRVILYYIQYY